MKDHVDILLKHQKEIYTNITDIFNNSPYATDLSLSPVEKLIFSYYMAVFVYQMAQLIYGIRISDEDFSKHIESCKFMTLHHIKETDEELFNSILDVLDDRIEGYDKIMDIAYKDPMQLSRQFRKLIQQFVFTSSRYVEGMENLVERIFVYLNIGTENLMSEWNT